MAGLKINTEPSVEPISTAEAKTFLRIDSSAEDTLIDNLIKTSRIYCEEYTGRSLINQTWDFYLDGFSEVKTDLWEGMRIAPDISMKQRYISIPRPPLVSVTSITTYDDADTATVFSSSKYYVDNVSEPARIVLRDGQAWPTSLRVANAVKITYVSGYGESATNIPEALITGIKEHILYMYENRGDNDSSNIPVIAKQLYQPYKILRFNINAFANNTVGSQLI